jgi:3-dehydroquinate dehydratase-2
MPDILLIHGPNLNLLGEREPGKYGYMGSEELLQSLRTAFGQYELAYFQSNIEGELVDAIQNARNVFRGIVINAGAFSHTSIAMADAIRSIGIPCLAVHITNIYNREPFRQIDIVGEACDGAIVGLGMQGYHLAIECLVDLVNAKN